MVTQKFIDTALRSGNPAQIKNAEAWIKKLGIATPQQQSTKSTSLKSTTSTYQSQSTPSNNLKNSRDNKTTANDIIEGINTGDWLSGNAPSVDIKPADSGDNRSLLEKGFDKLYGWDKENSMLQETLENTFTLKPQTQKVAIGVGLVAVGLVLFGMVKKIF